MTKTMEQLNINYKIYHGHNKPLLFNMIPLDHWLVDELHVMLRITDCLWNLMLNEPKKTDLFDDLTRNVITNEMDHIDVKFQIWKDKESENWNYTSLTGGSELWNKFSGLYYALRNDNTDPDELEEPAKEYSHHWI
ncbi:hypothetical protein RclHR1_10690005 [Rhizophagus clarus]|uniref:POU-specific domain-containing protein n=1 Tax=Rhizophagus clarus TaxID=94130 RepID=A0A2Z6Q6S1_9GLOM|nr:hypothetical protein RclHR1_10690005 [Rhizophagus clarus]